MFQNLGLALLSQVMAGRGGRGAILEALLAQQRRPGVEDGSQAVESLVRKYI
jgi:hypothetical protein